MRMNKIFLLLIIIYLPGCSIEKTYWAPTKPLPVNVESEINTSQYEVSFKVPPRYPYKARSIKQEGWVLVRFLVSEYGYTTDINIVDSSPPNIFDNSVLIALSKWEFRVKGNVYQASPIYQLFKFNLED